MSFTCDDCNKPVVVHPVLDSEDWERVAGNAYCLCPPCIDLRASAMGMSIECELIYRGNALHSLITPRVAKAGPWRPSEYIRLEGAGLPSLRKGHGT